jgi:DNA invertase Pin-like site-specific DNA recombinase
MVVSPLPLEETTTMSASVPKPVAYSYIRFSTPDQAKGGSLRRQTELAEAYCHRHGLVLSQDTYRDLGVSAFKGKNALVGNLGEFTRAIESGAIKSSSVLIVESLDRISRQDVDTGFQLVSGILRSGVDVVTLAPERHFTRESLRKMECRIEIEIILARAAEESERKSERVGHAWREKKRRAAQKREPLTERTPAWLRLVNGEYRVKDGAADAIRRIYEMAIAGHGLSIIARRLNADGVPGLGGSKLWGRSYVAKILRSRAVLGEYQPYKGHGSQRTPDGEPVPNYYPALITEAQWYAARAALTSRKGKAGRLAKEHINLFSGLLRNRRDGGTFHQSSKNKGYGPVLVPYHAYEGVSGSDTASFPLDTFERAILHCLGELKPEDILPDAPEGNRAMEITGRLSEVEVEMERLKNRLQARYTDAIADVLERCADEYKQLQQQLQEVEQENASPVSQAWGEAKSLAHMLDSADAEEIRIRLRAAIRRIVRRIDVLVVPTPRDRLAAVSIEFAPDGEHRRDYLICHQPAMGGTKVKKAGRWRVQSWTWEMSEITSLKFPAETQLGPDASTYDPPLPHEHGDWFANEEGLLEWHESIRNAKAGWHSLRPRPEGRKQTS